MADAPSNDKATFRCIVNADLFRRGSMCVSKENTRYYLSGALVEPCAESGALIVSTNGHVLTAIHDKSAFIEGGSAIVRLGAATLQQCGIIEQRLLRKKANVRRLVIQNQRAYVIVAEEDIAPESLFEVATQLTSAVAAMDWRDVIIDGEFPDWRRVIGDPIPGGACGSINLNVAKLVAEAFRSERGPRAHLPMKFVPTTEDGPHFVFVQNRDVPGFGVIMPIRHEPNISVPVWARKPQEGNLASAA